MIYVSSSCLKNDKIKTSVQELAEEGYQNIELSGGTNLYNGYLDDLLELKQRYNLKYLLHNYFPPPQKPFIINIASLNDEIYKKSIDHCLKAISLCKILGSKKYGVHAGFLIDFSLKESGKNILYKKMNDKNLAIERFGNALQKIDKVAGDAAVDLYVENNVLSKTNYNTYNGCNPFLLTDYKAFIELLGKFNFKLLFDLAHLKVSCNTLGLDFVAQSNQLIQNTDYLHVSGNDGLSDQNQEIQNDTSIMNFLKNINLYNKTLTIEVYNGLDGIRSSYEILKKLEMINNS